MASLRVSVLRRRVRRAVLGHRRLLAAALSAIAVLAGLQALRPASESTLLGASGVPGTQASMTLGHRLAADHPGLSVLPVRLPDAAMAALLEPGDRITLLATDGTGAVAVAVPGADLGAEPTRVVAADVEVVHVVSETDQNRVTSAAAGRLIIVGVPAVSASVVTAASVRSVLTYVWDR